MTNFKFATGSLSIREKWVLSSAVQKLIRRGRRDQAIDLALRLEEVSPGYLRRRLPIIAHEDIGAADDRVCLAVVQLCSSGSGCADTTDAITAAITALADAAKSRTACDAACLCEADPAVAAARSAIRGLPFDELLRIAHDGCEQWPRRAAALEVVGAKRGLSRDQAEAQLAKVADAFGLTEASHVLFRAHKCDVRPMALMLPLAAEALAQPKEVVDSPGLPGSDESVRGIPLCALDMYSRAGRGALSEFSKTSSELRRFRASCRKPVGLQKAVAMAVFHLDSCLLTRHVVTATSDELRERIEILELARFGISADERPHLYGAITADAGVLNRARDRVLRGLP